MDRLDLFNNLMVLAASDGKFTEEEIAFLMVRAEDWDIAQEDVEVALAGATSPDAELALPTQREEQVELMQEMVHLMAVDGELADIEKRLCAASSAAMGFTVDEFNQIVDSLL